MKLVVIIGLAFVSPIICPRPRPKNIAEILARPDNVDESGNTQLMILAQRDENSASIMKELLDNGADVNAKNIYGSTPVYEAAKNGNLDHVRMLISYGADITTELEATFQHVLRAALIKERGRGRNLDVVKLLVEKGANLTGSFPFLFYKGEREERGKITNDTDQLLEIAELFIARGVDLNESFGDDVGKTALSIAAFTGNKKTVKFLVEKGANLNLKRTQGCPGCTERGYTPILIAAKEKHVEVVEYLIQAGADVTVIGEDEFNLAAWAIQGGPSDHFSSRYDYNYDYNDDSRTNNVDQSLLLDLAKKGMNIDTPTNVCESDNGKEVCYDLIAWAAKQKYTEIVNQLSLTDETYYGDSTFQIATSAKLNNIMEKLNEIAKVLNIPEIED